MRSWGPFDVGTSHSFAFRRCSFLCYLRLPLIMQAGGPWGQFFRFAWIFDPGQRSAHMNHACGGSARNRDVTFFRFPRVFIPGLSMQAGGPWGQRSKTVLHPAHPLLRTRCSNHLLSEQTVAAAPLLRTPRSNHLFLTATRAQGSGYLAPPQCNLAR